VRSCLTPAYIRLNEAWIALDDSPPAWGSRLPSLQEGLDLPAVTLPSASRRPARAMVFLLLQLLLTAPFSAVAAELTVT
jgi:hypothetical protein